MAYSDFLHRLRRLAPLPGMVANDAGGHVYALDDWQRLDRFLLLGSAEGTYYVDAPVLIRANAAAVERAIAEDGARAVARIVAVSEAGRAPRNEPALFALALAASAAEPATRQLALAALPRVARTGAHLLAFAAEVDGLRGWGRGLRRAVAHWLDAMPVERLTLQAVKYGQRNGWALRDLLRLAHPLTADPARRALFDWIAHPDRAEAVAAARAALPLVDGVQHLRAAIDERAAAAAIATWGLPREAVPTPWLRSPAVWQALVARMPPTALLRALGKLAAVGLLAPGGAAVDEVVAKLGDAAWLTRGRVHPLQVLLALKQYAQGHGTRGRLAWTPDATVVDALDAAFDATFASVVPSGRNVLVAVDTSGSMHDARAVGSPALSALEAAAAIALLFVRTERQAQVVAFHTEVKPVALSRRQRLDDVLARLRQYNGGTDLAQPFLYALDRRLTVDAFVVVTDNETWAGQVHAVTALAEYRRRINPRARAVLLATAATHGQVVPADDALSLGIAGFDAAAPQLAMDFIAG